MIIVHYHQPLLLLGCTRSPAILPLLTWLASPLLNDPSIVHRKDSANLNKPEFARRRGCEVYTFLAPICRRTPSLCEVSPPEVHVVPV
jgi:hypothetical protein